MLWDLPVSRQWVSWSPSSWLRECYATRCQLGPEMSPAPVSIPSVLSTNPRRGSGGPCAESTQTNLSLHWNGLIKSWVIRRNLSGVIKCIFLKLECISSLPFLVLEMMLKDWLDWHKKANGSLARIPLMHVAVVVKVKNHIIIVAIIYIVRQFPQHFEYIRLFNPCSHSKQLF